MEKTEEKLTVKIVAHDKQPGWVLAKFSSYLDPKNDQHNRLQGKFAEGPDWSWTWNGTENAYMAQLTPALSKGIKEKLPEAELDELVELKIKTNSLLLDQADKRMKLIYDFLENKTVPDVKYSFKRPPMDHQKLGFYLAKQSPFLHLGWEMGTGKTQVVCDVMSALADEHKGDKPYRVLIVCPRAVLVNWVREMAMLVQVPYKVAIATWLSSHYIDELKEINCIGAAGGDVWSTELMLKLFSDRDSKLQVLVTNYEAIRSKLEAFKMVGFDMAVLDEGHKIKNFDGKQTKLCIELAPYCKRRLILTGTPVTQGARDLFSQYEFLAPEQGLLGYTSYYGHCQNYCKQGRNGPTGVQNQGKLLTHLSKWSFTIRKDQCMDLPPKVFTSRTCQMSESQAEVYELVANDVLVQLESLGAEISIQNILVQYLRLAQVTSGYVKTVDGRELDIGEDSHPKIDELMDLLEEENHPKTIVWTRFRNEVKMISERLEAAGIKHVLYYGDISSDKRQRAVDQFQNDPETTVFVGTMQTGGMGLNLTKASMVVYISNSFSLGDRLQSEDRAHRKGQEQKVTIVDIVVEGSIDELVLDRLNKKRKVADYFKDPTELCSSLRDFLGARLMMSLKGKRKKSKVNLEALVEVEKEHGLLEGEGAVGG